MSSVLQERIKLRRKQLELTQEDLAHRTDSTQSQIWQYESGRSMPSLDKLVELAKALETSTDWLLGLSEEIMPIHSSQDLSDIEIDLVNLYRSKSPEQQQKIILNIAKV